MKIEYIRLKFATWVVQPFKCTIWSHVDYITRYCDQICQQVVHVSSLLLITFLRGLSVCILQVQEHIYGNS
ncbi:hypothetical protein LDENG_00247320 [Lucifuga dentata]|nr:hypothetical protein LDENG_00247320 [Lucifuga dentata]